MIKLVRKFRRMVIFTKKDAFDLAVIAANNFKGLLMYQLGITDKDIQITITEENIDEHSFAQYYFQLVESNHINFVSITTSPQVKQFYEKRQSYIHNKSIDIYVINILKNYSFNEKYYFAKKVIECLAHELYHVLQHEKDKNAFEDYIEAGDNLENYNEYKNQPIEVEANDFAKTFVFDNADKISDLIRKVWWNS
jgi:hypothetical protein